MNVGEPYHAGTTLNGATTEKHVLRGKRSSYNRRTVRPLQSAAPYVRCMSVKSTFEYSSYCLGNRFANTDFQWDRCSRNLPFNVLYPVVLFRTGVRGARLVPRKSRGPQNPFDVYRSSKPTANLRHWVEGGAFKALLSGQSLQDDDAVEQAVTDWLSSFFGMVLRYDKCLNTNGNKV
ncbi:hypothetical protein AVEN_122620-1 [Araneus ventricosus]|uniref:Uncharacterized protein n=1 Tax=Araneus ventricosus TaxID=182803 RepID=A0A4Y2JW12_ARAVE|nr:hypothetical protein AVEN_122620-1 [Araneus ventricosus]